MASNKIFFGWWVALVSLCLTTTAFGVFYSFSVFMPTWLDKWGSSRAFLSGVYSLSFLMYGLASVVMGYLTDRFGLRRTLALGGAIMGSGCLLTALVQSDWVLYLSWGLAIGIGVGTSYSPTAAAVSRWFIHQKGLAVGLVVSGLGLGTLIFPPLVENLIARLGWRVTVAILGLIVWVVYFGAAFFIRGHPEEKGLTPLGQAARPTESTDSAVPAVPAKGSLLFAEAIRERSFWILFVIHGLWVMGMSMTMVHLVPFALDLGQSAATAALMLALVGGLSVLGRVALAVVIEKLGTKWSLIGLMMFQAGTMLLLALSRSAWGLWFFTVLFGFSYGGLASVFPLATSEFFGLKNMGSIFGVILLGATLGGAIGPTLAGYVFDVTNEYYLAFMSACLAMIGGGLLAFFIKSRVSLKE